LNCYKNIIGINWDINKAINELERTLRVLGVVDEKKESSLILELSVLYEEKGELNKALEVCQKALQILLRFHLVPLLF